MGTTARARAFSLLMLPALAALAGCDQEVDVDQETICRNKRSELSVTPESRALLVNEPIALSGLPLEDVLQRIIDLDGDPTRTPMGLMQRMFDTANSSAGGVFAGELHCDTPSNPAHVNAPAADCPRPEGALAKSTGFFTEGHPDHFYPVAVVNRPDLRGTSGCGEARIVYAKTSGLTDPDNRVFLIIESRLASFDTSGYFLCQKGADFWKSLESKAPQEVALDLRDFFFRDHYTLSPPLAPQNLGFGATSGSEYYGPAGQIRLSQHVGGHWEMRQFQLGTRGDGEVSFEPRLVAANPMPSLFDPGSDPEKHGFWVAALGPSLPDLASSDPAKMKLTTSSSYLSGESAMGGQGMNDYVGRAAGDTELKSKVQQAIDEQGLSAGCPPDDPLTADSIVRRVTVDSCAGCHAPTQFLGPERKIGCGLTWPDSLGEVHIDEHGNLSPALRDVFLPRRAKTLTSLLQACTDAELGLESP